jgi:hypothetical protein
MGRLERIQVAFAFSIDGLMHCFGKDPDGNHYRLVATDLKTDFFVFVPHAQ